MPKRAKELTAIEVRRLNKPGFHVVGGVSGLGLRINHAYGKSWILRTVIGSKRRDIGLGSYPDVSLAVARETATAAKASIVQGIDPIAERLAARAALAAGRSQGMTFAEAVDIYLGSSALEEFRNEKHRKQWPSTLHKYAVPYLGKKLLQEITASDVKALLDPIWLTKNETATRVRARVEKVLSWAKASGHRTGENPARWKENLSEMLPASAKVAKSENHPALPIDVLPLWFAALQKREGIAARALEFLALAAARSGEIREAAWTEVDLDQRLWVIPANRMKAGKEHRVPLTDQMLKILEDLPRLQGNALIFPALRGKQMSDMTLSAVMRRMHQTELDGGRKGWLDPRLGRPAVPHGLRSTFRDWVAERTSYERDMAEIALAHTVGSEVERAYRRGDMLEKRRKMMEAWSTFATSATTKIV